MSILIDQARRGDRKALEQARPLIGEIKLRRGDWWGVPILQARLAELGGNLGDAIKYYQEAIKQGGTRPDVARRLVSLLNQLGRHEEIDALVASLAAQGLELEDLKLATALGAIRKGEFDRAVNIARQTVPADSTDPFDHVTLGKVLQAAGRTEEAGAGAPAGRGAGPRRPGRVGGVRRVSCPGEAA